MDSSGSARSRFTRKQDRITGEFLEFNESLFANAIMIEGVRVARVNDDTGRYISTWKDERGADRISVCGFFGPSAVMYRYAKRRMEMAKPEPIYSDGSVATAHLPVEEVQS